MQLDCSHGEILSVGRLTRARKKVKRALAKSYNLCYGLFMELNTQLATLVQADRKSLKLTQEEYAEKFGVTRQLVYVWEHGLSQPNPDALAMMGIEIVFQKIPQKRKSK